MTPGPLIILSGPSGGGKSTVVRRLLAEGGLPLRLSVSATTRPRRPKEQEGVDYFFWTRERFAEQVAAGAFLEWAEYAGNLYGTLRSEVDGYRARGLGVLLEIDVQGAEQVLHRRPDATVILLLPPSDEVQAQRLAARGDDEEHVRRRVELGQAEVERGAKIAAHTVVNDDLERAITQLTAIVDGTRTAAPCAANPEEP